MTRRTISQSLLLILAIIVSICMWMTFGAVWGVGTFALLFIVLMVGSI